MWSWQAMIAMRAALHSELSGEGQPIVLLHGWGMHAGVMRPLSAYLAHKHAVAAVDLPGHGESAAFDQFDDLNRLTIYIVEQLEQLLTPATILIGWSLGGLLAQAIAIRYPQYVHKLILLCTSPCFEQRDDWHCAVEDIVLAEFAANLQRDYQGTLSRFLALQFFGSSKQKEELRRARTLLFARPPAQPVVLQQGLQLLQNSDVRAQLSSIQCPTLVINGERDTLVPSAAGRYLAEQVGDGRCVIIKGAGHAPFLSHTEIVLHFLERFIYEY